MIQPKLSLLVTNLLLLCLRAFALHYLKNSQSTIPVQRSLQKIPRSFFASLTSLATSVVIISNSLGNPLPAYAFGPTNLELSIVDYKQVDLCNGKKPIMPGQKAAEGLYPICIEVEANIVNREKTSKTFTDVSVYGFVKEQDAGNSVLPNNPDFKSDSGQYAMIPIIKPSDTTASYQFVAAVSANPAKEAIPKLTFQYTKAVAFPGGEKFKPLSECEIDPRAPGCDGDEED